MLLAMMYLVVYAMAEEKLILNMDTNEYHQVDIYEDYHPVPGDSIEIYDYEKGYSEIYFVEERDEQDVRVYNYEDEDRSIIRLEE